MRNRSQQALERAKLKRRVRQLENCLLDVKRWTFHRLTDLNGQGADNEDNENFRELWKLRNRVARTLPDKAPTVV